MALDVPIPEGYRPFGWYSSPGSLQALVRESKIHLAADDGSEYPYLALCGRSRTRGKLDLRFNAADVKNRGLCTQCFSKAERDA